MPDALQTLSGWVRESRSIVFFGGAGVSTESGIPDFRSVDGLYSQHYAYPPETILSHAFFLRHTEEFFRFYREKMLFTDKQPNAAHKKLALWEREGKLKAVVTQNIDGLHQMAGSQNVLELHGSIHHNHCVKCGRAFPLSFVQESRGIPRCPCGGVVKPDVVLYEESLDADVIDRSVAAIAGADMLIVGGTSLTVYPAASFIDLYRGSRLVLVNKGQTPKDGAADLVLREPIGEVFAQLP